MNYNFTMANILAVQYYHCTPEPNTGDREQVSNVNHTFLILLGYINIAKSCQKLYKLIV